MTKTTTRACVSGASGATTVRRETARSARSSPMTRTIKQEKARPCCERGRAVKEVLIYDIYGIFSISYQQRFVKGEMLYVKNESH